MSYAPDFKQAVDRAIEDFARYGQHGDTEMTEAGEMRVVGINRSDTVQLSNLLLSEFGPDLMAGGDKLTAALIMIVEHCMSAGVHLERARWQLKTGAL